MNGAPLPAAEAYNNLGVIYKERDNLEKAIECYITALCIKPNFPQVSTCCVTHMAAWLW